MRSRTRSLHVHGQSFHFQYVPSSRAEEGVPLWSASRGREFIGMMPCSDEVTTKDFDIRGSRWLDELLGIPPGS
jgi:hypothetical protein